MRNFKLDFMGNRWWLLGLSAVLIAMSLGSLAIKGLNFGIEFEGGTAINFTDAGDATLEDMRAAFEAQGLGEAVIQSVEGGGFIVRLDESDPQKANEVYLAVVEELGVSEDSGEVTTIGPGWGRNITQRSLLALALSIAAILLYTALRFEYKMSITAVLALLHDAVIVLGIYSLSGREVTPNTIAALLTILGYSLYDTIVVFHRIRENSQRLSKQTFMQMANDSINQVLLRWLNTSLTSIIPPIVMLFFGGETLKDFAFALVVGLLSGAYSSVGVASPVYAMWKETEPKFQALKKKYAQGS